MREGNARSALSALDDMLDDMAAMNNNRGKTVASWASALGFRRAANETVAPATRRRAILHIGDRKTGSTTIQQFLLDNREALPAHGVFVSEAALRHSYHSGLTCFALDDDAFGHGARQHWRIADTTALRRFRADFKEKLLEEARSAPVGATILFSHEDLFEMPPAAVWRLAELIASIFADVVVIVYLRRQVDREVSEYTQRLRALDKDPELLVTRGKYHKMLSSWSAAFGEKAIEPRIFERERLVGGDLLQDFGGAIGLSSLDGLAPPSAKNLSMNREAQEFLRVLTEMGLIEAGPRKAFLDKKLSKLFAGQGRLPTRQQATAFMKRFARSNEKLRARWFPDQETLFSTDYSMFPETDPPSPSFEDAARIGVGLLDELHDARDRERQHLQDLRQRRRADRTTIHWLKAQVAVLEDRLKDARAHLMLALKDPAEAGRARTYLALAEIEVREDNLHAAMAWVETAEAHGIDPTSMEAVRSQIARHRAGQTAEANQSKE